MTGASKTLTHRAATVAVACVALLLVVFVGVGRAAGSLAWGTGIKAGVPLNADANPNVSLFSASCPSVGSCTAVGDYFDPLANQRGLLLTESSGAWATGVEPTLPVNAQTNPDVHLAAVSCASQGNCTAVGFYTDNSGETQGLMLSETSGVWGAGVEANLPGDASTSPNVDLISVSCASAGNCTAVGGYDDSTGNPEGLLLTETPGVWAAGVETVLPLDVSTSNPNVDLTSVSCGSAGNCSAVGSYADTSDNTQALVVTQTAGVWAAGLKATPPANVGGNPNAEILFVSCASAGNCTAVGDYEDSSGHEQGLLLQETAGSWATGVEATPPANAGSNPLSSFSSVSCPSAGNCTAVGNYRDSSGKTQGEQLTESAGTWSTVVETTLPADASTGNPQVSLSSVFCAVAGTCAAVGSYVDGSGNQQGLLLSEVAGVWAAGVKALLPSGAATTNQFVDPASVSCASAIHCAAVGQYSPTAGDQEGLLFDTAPANPGLALQAPASATAGGAIAATAVTGTLSAGLAPTGTLTFTVFGRQSSPPTTCTSGGRIVGTATVSGNSAYHPSAAFTPAVAGSYWWYAAFSGDTSDNPAASACGTGVPKTVVTVPVAKPSSDRVRLVGSPKAVAGGVTFTLGCSSQAGRSCRTDDTLTSTETLRGGRPISVAAAGKRRKRTVTVAHVRVTITTGRTKKITIMLNAGGRKLLARFGKLPVTLTV
ncbi:MAG: hypothetical protein ACJ76X_13660, partial [Solirubrobacteraceae bacterium]